MDYQIIELEEFNVIGIRYELSKSLSNNVKLAQNHWKIFNSKLRNNKLYLGSNWCKYAFIEKIENKIFYYISIPKKDFVPNDFTENRQFVYFEKYDYKFHWNREDSVIEIYIPIK